MPRHNNNINDGNTFVIYDRETGQVLEGRRNAIYQWTLDPKGAWSFTDEFAAVQRAREISQRDRTNEDDAFGSALSVIPRREALELCGRQLIPGVHNA